MIRSTVGLEGVAVKLFNNSQSSDHDRSYFLFNINIESINIYFHFLNTVVILNSKCFPNVTVFLMETQNKTFLVI